MKICLAQLNFHTGNFDANLHKIMDSIRSAKANLADLIVFPELAICGYPPRDFLEFNDFILECEKSIELIKTETEGIAVIVGAPSRNPNILGKNLFNSAFVIQNKKTLAVIHKGLLPTYDIFDEYRYFEPFYNNNTVEINGVKIALTICEDIWNVEDDPLYSFTPMDKLMEEKPEIMINISASPFHFNQAAMRDFILKRNVSKYGIPLVYVNHIGAQTELIFDGNSCVYNSKGESILELNSFEEDCKYYDFPNKEHNAIKKGASSKFEKIEKALVLGIQDYFRKLGFKKALIGLSGGVDSALVTTLAAKALGPENVHVILMPSPFSSGHSISDSIDLVNNLGVSHHIVPINSLFETANKTLEPIFENRPHDLTEENIQARLRGLILMSYTNKFGHILLNTSNKSEMAVGYGTLYGDMCGGLSVIGDLYKTEVYGLCDFINRNEEVIPKNILTKAPSAELRPDQKDSDSLPEYDVLDKVLFHYIEERLGPKEIISIGFEKALVERICKLVNINEYKRHQTPPILRVSNKAFGMGRRLPIVAKYLS